MPTLSRALTALLLSLISAPLQAHLLNMTRVQVDLNADNAVNVQITLDLTRETGGGATYYALSRSQMPQSDARISPLLTRLAQSVDLRLDGHVIALEFSDVQWPSLPEAEFLSPMAWPMTEMRLRGTLPSGANSGELQMRFDPAFAFEEPIALTLQRANDGGRMTRWLVAGQLSPRFPLRASTEPATAPEPAWKALSQYLVFGFRHILPGGLDHLLFVLGLYWGARNLHSLLWLVTSFTLAHSLTLILSSFGALRVPAAVVEPLIALSIAWIGIENLRSDRPRGGRVLIVFAFGLLHGLGFAAALKDLGLPPANFLGALLSFNLGVELGQLSVIAMALLLTGWWRQHPLYRRWVVLPGSATITLLALVWTVQRVIV